MQDHALISIQSWVGSFAVHAAIGCLCMLPRTAPPPASEPTMAHAFSVSLVSVINHSDRLAAGTPAQSPIAPMQSIAAQSEQPRSLPPPSPKKAAPAALKFTHQPKKALPASAPSADPASQHSSSIPADGAADTGTSSNTLYGQGGDGLPGSGNYEALVVSHLNRVRQYPERARRRGIEGDVVLAIAIDRDGSLRHSEIARSSDFSILDEEAVRMVERAAPFPAPPRNYKPGQVVSFKIPIRFELQG